MSPVSAMVYHWHANPLVVLLIVVIVSLVVTAMMSRRHVRQTDPRLCRGCGTSHPRHAQFCRRCGRSLDASSS